MKKYLPILKNCPLFSSISDDDIINMLHCLGAKIHQYEKRQEIFSENSSAKHIGILLSGSAQMIRIDYNGNRSILGSICPSDLFGEEFACSNLNVMSVSIVCDTDAEVMLIDADHILHTCQKGCGFHWQMIYNLMQEIAGKAVAFHQKIEIISKRTTREKLLTYLSFESIAAGSKSFSIPFDRQALADYLEVDRSGLSAEIGKLKKDGVLNCRKNLFTLL